MGKIFGIPILLDYSFFLSLVLVTFLLGAEVLPDRVRPEPDPVLSWALGAVGAVVFFTSLLMHELAHSVAARLYGLHVANITLFILGGVSQIKEESHSPMQEFVIAFVGPLTSAILGGLFIAAALLVGGANELVPELLLWLGAGNIIIAIFNMLPGFPLDGGRVFRSLLWGITGNRNRSTRWAARVGQGFAALMVGWGVISLVDIGGIPGTGFGGIMFIFVGVFLYNAATQTVRSVEAQQILAGVVVRDFMSTDLRTVEASAAVRWTAPFRDNIDPRTAYLVTDSGTVVGLATGASLLLVDAERYQTATMRDVMIPAANITPIPPSATGQEALERLQVGDTPLLPVVENGKLLGLIGLDQVVAALQPDGAAAV
ncbi:MAG: Zn-dependent protease (includes SpoIVFB) [Chloroflexi bacterium]|nr:MAG: Zn-dependent protease (includes SpoIVFB) [Chloroflexota bacterium]